MIKRFLVVGIFWSVRGFLGFCKLILGVRKPTKKRDTVFCKMRRQLRQLINRARASWFALRDVKTMHDLTTGDIPTPKLTLPDVLPVALIMELYGSWTPYRFVIDEIIDFAEYVEEKYALDLSEPYEPRYSVHGIIYALKELWLFIKDILLMYHKHNVDEVRARVFYWKKNWTEFFLFLDFTGMVRESVAFFRHYQSIFFNHPIWMIKNVLWYWPYFIYMVMIRHFFPLLPELRQAELKVFVRTFPSAEEKLAVTLRVAYIYLLLKHYRWKEFSDPTPFPTDEAEIRTRLCKDEILILPDQDVWDVLFGKGLGDTMKYVFTLANEEAALVRATPNKVNESGK